MSELVLIQRLLLKKKKEKEMDAFIFRKALQNCKAA